MTVCNFTMFDVQSYIIHFCICHESRLTVCIDLILYQCSGVLDGTWYIMPNTTFRIVVICSGYMQFILSTRIVIMYSIILIKCYTLKIPRSRVMHKSII